MSLYAIEITPQSLDLIATLNSDVSLNTQPDSYFVFDTNEEIEPTVLPEALLEIDSKVIVYRMR